MFEIFIYFVFSKQIIHGEGKIIIGMNLSVLWSGGNVPEATHLPI